MEISLDWLKEEKDELSFIDDNKEYKRTGKGPRATLERVPILSALEKAVIFIINLLKKRKDMRNDMEQKFKNLQHLKQDGKGPTSLETLAGL